MFVYIADAEGVDEIINTKMVTKVFHMRGGVRINMCDGSYIVTDMDMEEVFAVLESN